ITRIEGEAGVVAVEFLLKSLKADGIDHPGLNKYLLKDALSRRPEIISFRKFRVGHAAYFKEHDLRLIDRIEAILRVAERPLSIHEISERLPHSTEYSINSFALSGREAPFAVNIGHKYAHIQSLGITEDQCRRLVEMTVDLMPPDGSPISCLAILNGLRAHLPGLGIADLVHREDVADVLRGLLRLKADVICGAEYLVGRRVKGKEQTLLKQLIRQITRDAIVVSPRDVLRVLAD